jgi:2-methylisocitrate lyase-like PEP mutase family enzyme
MTVTQAAKAQQFRALHQGPDAFVVANVWDGGSARMMAALGFAALATSSGASAGLLGRRDGRVTRDEALAQARVICDATDLPVSADLEKGFGDAPEIVAETIRLAAEAGLVGCSIEDATGNQDAPIRTPPGDGADCGRGSSGTGTAVPVHADRADRKFSARPARSGRHDQAAEGV